MILWLYAIMAITFITVLGYPRLIEESLELRYGFKRVYPLSNFIMTGSFILYFVSLGLSLVWMLKHL